MAGPQPLLQGIREEQRCYKGADGINQKLIRCRCPSRIRGRRIESGCAYGNTVGVYSHDARTRWREHVGAESDLPVPEVRINAGNENHVDVRCVDRSFRWGCERNGSSKERGEALFQHCDKCSPAFIAVARGIAPACHDCEVVQLRGEVDSDRNGQTRHGGDGYCGIGRNRNGGNRRVRSIARRSQRRNSGQCDDDADAGNGSADAKRPSYQTASQDTIG